MGSHSLLQGIFLTEGLNSGLPHSRQILYCLSHQGSPHPTPPRQIDKAMTQIGMGGDVIERFLILWSRKEQISDSWLQRKNHYVYQRLGSSVTFGARGREGKCRSSLHVYLRFQEGIENLEYLNICLSSSCPFHFPSNFSFPSS